MKSNEVNHKCEVCVNRALDKAKAVKRHRQERARDISFSAIKVGDIVRYNHGTAKVVEITPSNNLLIVDTRSLDADGNYPNASHQMRRSPRNVWKK